MTRPSSESGDQRLLRGARSRRIITRRAVDIASLDGLGGISFGRLADELTLSKAGIQTLFRTKENLQLATAETAGEVFVDAVVAPASAVEDGIPRLRALIDRWVVYASEPLFPGGCFWSANLPEVDSHPGPIRDTLVRQHREWLRILARPLERAARTDSETAAFRIDAVLKATNLALRLGENGSVDRALRVVDDIIAADSPRDSPNH